MGVCTTRVAVRRSEGIHIATNGRFFVFCCKSKRRFLTLARASQSANRDSSETRGRRGRDLKRARDGFHFLRWQSPVRFRFHPLRVAGVRSAPAFLSFQIYFLFFLICGLRIVSSARESDLGFMFLLVAWRLKISGFIGAMLLIGKRWRSLSLNGYGNEGFNDFGVDGGPAAEAFRPKYNRFTKHATSHLGLHLPPVEIKQLVAASIAMKGIGGILFIFGSTFGAYLLILQLAFVTPILYDFYNYDNRKPEFLQIFIKFTENLALFGALLFFLGMKNSIPKRSKKKLTKSKTA
ncbi:hypothetical protein ACLOJK_024601 [Asimina triloba]